MTVTSLTTAERIACAICWLYRWRGDQPPYVQYEVAERHGTTCDWCDFPMAELVRLCNLNEKAGDTPHDYEIFRRLPSKIQRDMVVQALHAEVPA